uniref:Uncharacterized protein n=1 Tax=Cyprinus carpio TaxID=7962 RepID=A0A8C2FJ41_CYPCA
ATYTVLKYVFKRGQPRVMIARIHHFKTKDKILQLARKQFPLCYKGRPIHIFPDLPGEIMKQRHAFSDVRNSLGNTATH